MIVPTSELVQALRVQGGEPKISLGEIAAGMGGRGNGLLLLALALPEMIPMVGLSLLIAVPIFVIGACMLLDGDDTVLPGWIRRRRIKRSLVDGAIDKTLPMLRWLDRISRPRWHALAQAGRLHGVVCILMAVVLAIPIPGVNILAALGVGGIGIGMLQRDGVLILAALACSTFALAGTVLVFTGAASLFG